MQMVAQLGEHAHGTEHHGHMAVVPTRMHDALVHGGVFRSGELCYGKRVDIGAQCHAMGGIARFVIGARRRAANGRDDARANEVGPFVSEFLGAHALDESVLDAQLVELVTQVT